MKTKNSFFYLIALFSISLISCEVYNNPINIEGYLYDPYTNEPIQNAQIFLRDENIGPKNSYDYKFTNSDDLGFYSINHTFKKDAKLILLAYPKGMNTVQYAIFLPQTINQRVANTSKTQRFDIHYLCYSDKNLTFVDSSNTTVPDSIIIENINQLYVHKTKATNIISQTNPYKISTYPELPNKIVCKIYRNGTYYTTANYASLICNDQGPININY